MKRFFPLAAALTCILLVLAFLLMLTGGEERPHSEGERLSLSALRANEEVIVSTLFSHRREFGREYRVRGEGHRRTVTIFDTTPAWSRDDGKPSGAVLLMRDLSTAEIAGLDQTVACYREARKEVSSASRHIRIRYLRDGKQIGEEFYVGLSLPERIAWARRGEKVDLAQEYADLAQSSGVSIEKLYRMIPFEMLEREEPSQAPEPTAPGGRG